MKPKILVLGALGNVGAEVVNSLILLGNPVRVADLDLQKIKERFGNKVEALAFDFLRTETYSAAFHDIESMFLLRPPQISNVQKIMFPALEAARKAGVKHIVFLSLIGIEENKVVPHYKVEQWLVNSGLRYTFMRCSFFMQNLNTTHRLEIRDRNEIFLPVGNAKTSFLDVRDIGAVAALALTENGYENKAYDLTGAEALDYYQVAELFSKELGRGITYKNPNSISFFFRLLTQKTPIVFALIQTWLYGNTRKGMAVTVTGEVERFLNRKPTLMREYIHEFRSFWEK